MISSKPQNSNFKSFSVVALAAEQKSGTELPAVGNGPEALAAAARMFTDPRVQTLFFLRPIELGYLTEKVTPHLITKYGGGFPTANDSATWQKWCANHTHVDMPQPAVDALQYMDIARSRQARWPSDLTKSVPDKALVELAPLSVLMFVRSLIHKGQSAEISGNPLSHGNVETFAGMAELRRFLTPECKLSTTGVEFFKKFLGSHYVLPRGLRYSLFGRESMADREEQIKRIIASTNQHLKTLIATSPKALESFAKLAATSDQEFATQTLDVLKVPSSFAAQAVQLRNAQLEKGARETIDSTLVNLRKSHNNGERATALYKALPFFSKLTETDKKQIVPHLAKFLQFPKLPPDESKQSRFNLSIRLQVLKELCSLKWFDPAVVEAAIHFLKPTAKNEEKNAADDIRELRPVYLGLIGEAANSGGLPKGLIAKVEDSIGAHLRADNFQPVIIAALRVAISVNPKIAASRLATLIHSEGNNIPFTERVGKRHSVSSVDTVSSVVDAAIYLDRHSQLGKFKSAVVAALVEYVKFKNMTTSILEGRWYAESLPTSLLKLSDLGASEKVISLLDRSRKPDLFVKEDTRTSRAVVQKSSTTAPASARL